MTSLRLETPTRCRIIDPGDVRFLKGQLEYRDKKVDFELNKLQHSRFQLMKMGEAAWKEEIQRLKGERVKSLLFQDDDGYWTHSGLVKSLARNLRATEEPLGFDVPEPDLIPWKDKPALTPHPYQDEALEALLAARHAGVEMGTGLGKSLIIMNLLKSLGLRAVVMAPNISIARQLYEGEDGRGGLKAAFGKKYVGLYGDNRKDVDKLITVAIGASLTRIEKGGPAWEFFSKAAIFIADESHLCPAKTLEKVCHGLMANAPYRFFFSATQLRNDGLDLLLDAITGPIVYRMSVRQGIDQGYLARLKTTFLKVGREDPWEHRDVLEMTRHHLFYNSRVNRLAGYFADRYVEKNNCQVLILVEELEQFTCLLPFIHHEVQFAHGGDPRGMLPVGYRKSDPQKLVKAFNAGELPILVGTSCISTGTDIRNNRLTIYLRGGISEIEVMQGAVGRSTRLNKAIGKTACDILDIDVFDVESLHRHALRRRQFYNSVGPVTDWDPYGVQQR